MEGLRGAAVFLVLLVFLVFLVHYATLIAPRVAGSPLAGVADAMQTISNRGVDLFFVLSGYLIYGSPMSRPQPFAAFMLRRIERIYPAFLVVFAIYLALAAALPGDRAMPHPWQAAATCIAANLLLLPGLLPIEALVTVAWSLSYEMFYYLVTPLLVAALALRTRSRGFRVALFSLTALALAT